jgi:hypothetical protein
MNLTTLKTSLLNLYFSYPVKKNILFLLWSLIFSVYSPLSFANNPQECLFLNACENVTAGSDNIEIKELLNPYSQKTLLIITGDPARQLYIKLLSQRYNVTKTTNNSEYWDITNLSLKQTTCRQAIAKGFSQKISISFTSVEQFKCFIAIDIKN